MQCSWIFSAAWQPDIGVDLDQMHDIAPSWGSWKSWRQCGTNNVICYDSDRCRDLLGKAFQAVCNFYIPKSVYDDLRPQGCRVFGGEFPAKVTDIEDIVSMHLASTDCDLVMLLGFDFAQCDTIGVENQHRMAMMRQIIQQRDTVQWVLIDHDAEIAGIYQSLTNLTSDTLQNAVQLLSDNS